MAGMDRELRALAVALTRFLDAATYTLFYQANRSRQSTRKRVSRETALRKPGAAGP